KHPLHLRGLRGDVGDRVDELLARPGEEEVPALLEGDGARGLPTHAGPTARASEVPWIDLQVVGERQELAVDAVVELIRLLSGVAGQVRTADGPDEERVAGEDEPRIGAAAEVGDHEADALRRVPGRVEDPDPRVAELHLLAIMEGLEGTLHAGRGVQTVGRSGFLRECRTSGPMIGVN